MKNQKKNPSPRRIAAITGGILVALVVALSVVFAFVDSELVARRVADHLLPRVSERVGRNVTVEGVRARILPNPHVFLTGFTVEGKGKEPPMVEAAELEVDLALWPLISSLGKKIEVQAVRLLRPELNLLRNKDGSWNYEDLQRDDTPSDRDVLLSKVQIEDGTVRIIDRSTSHGEATVALTQLDATASNIGEGRPMKVEAQAAFAADSQNVKVDLSLADAPRKLEGTFNITNGSLARLEGFLPARLGRLITGGAFNLDARLSTTEDGRYQVDGSGGLRALKIRGEPADGSLRLAARVDPENPKATQVNITDLKLNGPGIDLGGTATFTAEPRRVAFALEGQRLDLETLLGVMPEEEPKEAKTAALPAQMRKSIEDVSASGTLKIAEVVNGKFSARNLDAQATLERGTLTVTRGKAEVYGGSADASGTTVNLTREAPRWNLKARLQQVDLGAAMAEVSGQPALQGRIDAAMNVVGEGAEWSAIRENLTGAGTFALAKGALTSTDLSEKVSGALAQGLEKLGRPGAAATVEKTTGRTELENLRGTFTVKDGWLVLREPMGFSTSMGAAAVDGRIGLDLRLDLDGQIKLSQRFLAKVAPRGLAPAGGAMVPLELGGTLKAPTLEADPAEMARAVVAGQVRGETKGVEDEVRRQARKRLGGVLDRLGGNKD